jgi:hypothetical protein
MRDIARDLDPHGRLGRRQPTPWNGWGDDGRRGARKGS